VSSSPERGPLTSRAGWILAALLVGAAGVAMRASDLGAFGFYNDEAWVALCTRVQGFRQFWLSIVMTPVGWAVLLKGVSLIQVSEAALRAVPFLFGCATLWIAYRAGTRFAGHRLGGVLAVSAAAFDPLATAYAKVLKQYTAETFFCMLALDRAAVFAERRTPRALVELAAVCTLALAFSNAQLFVTPVVFGAVFLDALVRRDGRSVRMALVGGATVGLWAAGYYLLLIEPRLPDATDPYWGAQQYLPLDWTAARAGWTRLAWALRPALGPTASIVALLALAAGCAQSRQRVVATALLLLLLEIAGLSMAGTVPVSQPRILQFLTTSLAAFGAAALAGIVVRAWRRPMLGIAATAVLAVLAADFVRAHAWRRAFRTLFTEDAGPLVRLLESERQADDVVLLHTKTLFIYAYYQRAVPVLRPARGVSTGFLPVLTDPAITLVTEATLPGALASARASHPRGWLLASRQRREEEMRLRRKVKRAGAISRDVNRPGAFLLLIDFRPPDPTTK
jgi:hypothetical protein